MSSVPGGEEFEPCPGGVGWRIWTKTVRSLKRNTDVLSLNMDVFKGREFTFSTREDGSEVRYMTDLQASQPWNLIIFFLIFEIKCIDLHLNLERKLNDIDYSHKLNEIKRNVSLRSWEIVPLQSSYSMLTAYTTAELYSLFYHECLYLSLTLKDYYELK